MVDTTDNLLKEENGVTITEVQEALAEAEKVNSELRMKLDKIKIQVSGRDNPELVNAIKTLFGDKYIFSNGNSVISYDMYCYVIKLLRELGKAKAGELL